MNNDTSGALLLLFALVSVALTASGITSMVHNSYWQRECISRGVAEYDAKTAQFKWLVEPKDE